MPLAIRDISHFQINATKPFTHAVEQIFFLRLSLTDRSACGRSPLPHTEAKETEMNLTSLGRIAVPTPGTPVAISTNVSKRAARVVLQTAPANTGKTYFGEVGLVKATLAGVSRILAAADSYEISAADGTDGILLSQLSIDADNANEGLLVSYWTE